MASAKRPRFAAEPTRGRTRDVGLGALLVIIGIVLLILGNTIIGLLLIVVGLLFGGFRRGRWY